LIHSFKIVTFAKKLLQVYNSFNAVKEKEYQMKAELQRIMPTAKNFAKKKGYTRMCTSSPILHQHPALFLIVKVLYFQIIATSYCTCALIINSQSSGDALEKFQAWSKNANRNTGNKRNGVQDIIIK
jgi:hypothetical protein